MEQNIPLGFGGLPRETTEVFDLGALTPTGAVPSVFMPEYGMTIEMQAKQPACGPHAAEELKFILEKVDTGTAQRGSPKYAWIKVKQIDNLALNVGTDFLSLMKTIAKNGICGAQLLPNNVDVTLEQYADASVITPEMDADAAMHKIVAYAFQAKPTMDQLKAAIYNHKAVILLFQLGAEWWLPSWKESDILPLKPTHPITDGHFVTAYGYDENYIYFYNHWSEAWGRAGIGYFGADYISRCVDIATAVDLKNYQFTRDLKIGMTGTDVGVLQLLLKKWGFFPVSQSVTMTFGPITQKAVMDFQQKYASEILTPAGIATPSGNVLQYTRAKLNQLLAV